MSAIAATAHGYAPAALLRILDLITSQKLPIGSALPARRILLELYDVKKESIEQVWRHLGDAGALHSRKRAGTVVAAIPDDTKLAELRGWANRRATPSKTTAQRERIVRRRGEHRKRCAELSEFLTKNPVEVIRGSATHNVRVIAGVLADALSAGVFPADSQFPSRLTLTELFPTEPYLTIETAVQSLKAAGMVRTERNYSVVTPQQEWRATPAQIRHGEVEPEVNYLKQRPRGGNSRGRRSAKRP